MCVRPSHDALEPSLTSSRSLAGRPAALAHAQEPYSYAARDEAEDGDRPLQPVRLFLAIVAVSSSSAC